MLKQHKLNRRRRSGLVETTIGGGRMAVIVVSGAKTFSASSSFDVGVATRRCAGIVDDGDDNCQDVSAPVRLHS